MMVADERWYGSILTVADELCHRRLRQCPANTVLIAIRIFRKTKRQKFRLP
jgi:hypothetical protein